MKRPNSRRNLDAAILRAFGTEREALHARNLMANAIVGQMLPNGVVKGGSALSLRFGDSGTRFTSDLDTARAEALDKFVEQLAERLGCSKRTAERVVAELKAEGALSRQGSTRFGIWIVHE